VSESNSSLSSIDESFIQKPNKDTSELNFIIGQVNLTTPTEYFINSYRMHVLLSSP
jgi:hypothetical protein